MKYIVVGCGVSGVTIARILAEKNCKVEVWDRRNHIAGIMYDYIDEYGCLVHKYGPHIFHTNNEKVWSFVNRFEEWKPFKLICGCIMDGKYTPTAFNFRTIDTFYSEEDAKRLKEKLKNAYPDEESVTVVELLNHNDDDIRGYAEFLFANDYAPYTAKQWGVSPKEIDPSILKRVPIRLSYEESYFTDTHEAMPMHSYTSMLKNMLQHPNIEVKLETDALDYFEINEDRIKCVGEDDVVVVYTGAVDELFGYRFGELPYRSLRFEWVHENKESLQEAPVVAYPKANGYTRITEYKKLPAQNISGTTYAVEYPIPYERGQRTEPYYPVLTEESSIKFKQYEDVSKKIKNLVCCGRLGQFKYYNMDQAIESAMVVVENLLEKRE